METNKWNEEVIERTTNTFKLVLRIKDGLTAADRLIEKLIKTNKLGELKIPKEEHYFRKMGFIISKMRPVIANPSGEDFEVAKQEFFKEVFGNESN